MPKGWSFPADHPFNFSSPGMLQVQCIRPRNRALQRIFAPAWHAVKNASYIAEFVRDVGNHHACGEFNEDMGGPAMEQIPDDQIQRSAMLEVFSIAEFCRRYRIEAMEERRLRTLLGEFATQQELLMNARREPKFR